MLARLRTATRRDARRGWAIVSALNGGSEVRITCGNGSDLRFSIAGREGIVDAGELTGAGAFGNLPCGEGFIAPVEGTGRGPVGGRRLDRRDRPGRIAGAADRRGRPPDRATGDEGAELMALLTPHGPDGTNVAELGIGTNEEAILTATSSRTRNLRHRPRRLGASRGSAAPSRYPSTSTSSSKNRPSKSTARRSSAAASC